MTSQNVWIALWRSMRPGQWQKNLIAYAPLLFSAGSGWNPSDGGQAVHLLGRATFAVVLLSLAASGGYLLNDVRDAEADRAHPSKRLRAVAAGQLPIDGAISAGLGLIFAALTFSAFDASRLFYVIGGYCLATLAYSLLLRNIAGLDVLAVAGGFVLRAIAGAEAIAVPVSGWILLCTALGAAFVVLVKRAQERRLLREQAEVHRRSQHAYGPRGAELLATIVAIVTVVAYGAYTWTAPNLPANHAMMVTVPLVAFGLARYARLAERAPQRNADELIARDPLLLLTILVFAVTAFAVLVLAR